MSENVWETVNDLGRELASLQPYETDRRISLETQISSILIDDKLLRNVGGKAYYPLTKRFNRYIEYEDYCDMLYVEIMRLLRSYDPSKSTFTSALRFCMENRCKDWFEKTDRRSHNEMQIPATDSGDGSEEEIDLPDGTTYEQQETPFSLFCRVAEIVAERVKQESHLTKRSYFESFASFDAAKGLRVDGLFTEQEVCDENELLYPIMEHHVLSCLMERPFRHMRNVARNNIPDYSVFDKRLEAIRNCYGISHPTAVNRNKAYKDLFEAI
jgi:DNA-directed RNA polymerase specialized sigma24 family protein